MVRSLFVYAILLLPALVLPTLAHAQAPGAGRVTLLDFWLPTCGPCRQMDPVVARLHQQGFDVRKVDGSRQPQVAGQYRVEVYPTFVLLVDGREVWRTTGLVDESVLRASMVNASQAMKPATVAPVGYNAPATAEGASFQVGGDLGPAVPPAISPPSAFEASVTAATASPADAERLLNASVRLRVEDPKGHAFGTGTIIDARQGEALVLTCAHLFRDQASAGSISIELFETAGGAPRVVDRAPGQVIAVDMENDVALVTLRPNRPVRPARVAASLGAVTADAPVWSVGCDLGADPTVRVSRVNGVNRTHRPPNVTSTGAPVQGRSGGGLFNAAGEVVGVCFGADEKADEGLYADLVSIHAQLDKIGLSELYRGGATPLASGLASTAPVTTPVAAPVTALAAGPATTPVEAAATTPVPPPLVRAQTPAPAAGGQPFDLASLSPRERATLEELSVRAEESEVICIVRPKTAAGRSEVISLDEVSPAFLQALRAMQSGSPTR